MHDARHRSTRYGEWFGALPNGTPIRRFTLAGGALSMRVLDYGGIVTHVFAPDRQGRSGDVVLGHDSLDGYLGQSPYFGAIIGRYANRIARGAFTLDGQRYTLTRNDGPHALHGGVRGFDKVRWDVRDVSSSHLVLGYESADGDEGYPGTLRVTVSYALTPDHCWVIDYEARTDAPTPVNLSQHSYWNLTGDGNRDVLAHELTLHAESFTPVDATLIPTGCIEAVANTPFDFRTPVPIGARIAAPDQQLRRAQGYDHNWVLRAPGEAAGLRHAAHLFDPPSGRTLDVYTSEPGVQCYSGNFLDGTIRGKHGAVYERHHGVCLETQHFPDSPNQPSFPNTILRPGELFRSRSVYAFGVRG